MSSYLERTNNVHVKSYWETISELFAFCCCGRRDKDKTQYERLLEEEEEETHRKLEQSNLVLRWLALIISGQFLPDNQQLYALLHRFAGVLSGIAHSDALHEDDEDDARNREREAPLHQLGEATVSILEQCQALLKDVARWIASDDAVIGTGNEQQRIPNGNSRHQIQRIIFHSSQVFRQSPSTSNIKPDLDTAKELVPEVETAQRTAEQFAEDLRLALYSTGQVAITLLTCNQLLDAIRDSINLARDTVADAAEAVAHQVSGVESTVRPSQHERTEPAVEQVKELKEESSQQAVNLREGAQQVIAQAAQINTENIKSQAENVPHDLTQRAKGKLPSTDSVIDRFMQVVRELIENDDSFKQAIVDIVALTKKYTDGVKTAAQGVISKDLIVTADDNDDKIPSTGKEKQQSQPSLLESNPHLAELLTAGRQLLEGLAGGKSLTPIVNDVVEIWDQVKEEVLQAFNEWLQQTTEALEYDDQDDDNSIQRKAQLLSQSILDFVDKIRHSLQTRDDLKDKIDHVQRRILTFVSEIQREARFKTMSGRISAIWTILSSTFDTQAAALTQHGRELLNDTFNKILPSLLTILGSIPLPRIEFTSPEVDVALDDLSLAAINLIPASIHLETKEIFAWNRVHSHANQMGMKNLSLQVAGLRLALRDVSFFIREKVTETSSKWINQICCALPSTRKYTLAGREETGHVGAYKEAGLLDLGLFGKKNSTQGAKISLDVQFNDRTSDNKHDGDTTGFLKVKSSSFDLSDSFALHLHKTHHNIINTLLLEPILAPTSRLVLQSIGSSVITNGVEKLDSILWDYYQRARYLAAPQEEVGVKHFVRVILDKNAGKSPERREREKREKEEEQKRQQEQEQDFKKDPPATSQERTKVEVKPLAIILNPTPDISISIGAYPSLLPSYAQGGSTRRTRVRNAVVQNEWQEILKSRADETIGEIANGVQGVKSVIQQGAHAGKEFKAEVLDQVDQVAQQVNEVTAERREIEHAREEDHQQVDETRGEEFEWYHQGFDL
ncbi:unnamed protein product [Sympodiomycopsis kandeliae]